MRYSGERQFIAAHLFLAVRRCRPLRLQDKTRDSGTDETTNEANPPGAQQGRVLLGWNAFAAAGHDRRLRLADRKSFEKAILTAHHRPGKSEIPGGRSHRQ
jgi:hypothetical protein